MYLKKNSSGHSLLAVPVLLELWRHNLSDQLKCTPRIKASMMLRDADALFISLRLFFCVDKSLSAIVPHTHKHFQVPRVSQTILVYASLLIQLTSPSRLY